MALFGLLGGKKTSVGLDIGSGIIKLAVIDHSGSEPELVKVATTEVAADAIVEGEVMDPGLVSEAIRGLFSTAGVKQRSVVTAVGGRDVIVKKIQMDRMKEGDAREVIRWEAEQHVPFDMANVELDFQILDPDAEGLQMNVLLVAAKRELVESRVGLLTEAGLDPSVIDVDAFAIHNAFELNHPDAMQGVVGLVNIGHEVTNVNILEDGIPVLTRDLSGRHAAVPRGSPTRKGARERRGREGHSGVVAACGPGRVRQRPRRRNRDGCGARGGVPRDRVALGGRIVPRLHDGWRRAHPGPQRCPRRTPESADRAGESRAALAR